MSAVEQLVLDGRDVDDLARQLERLRPRPAVGAVAVDPHGDLGARRAAQVVDGLVEAHVERRLAVDLDDAVVLLDARAPGRRARHRVHHGELLVADGDDDAEAAELALRREVHLLVRLGREQHRVRVERVQHAVARRVLDVAQVDVGPAQAVLEEREDVAQVRAHVPGAAHVVDAERLLLRVDPHLHLGRVGVVADDDDLRDVLLDVVERREEHVLRLDALGVDVAVADGLEDLVDHLELRQVVGGGLVLGFGIARRDGRRETFPQATAVQPDREPVGDGEGAQQ